MSKSIFIVDDNAKVRTGVRHLLENQSGFEVCGEACDGADAVEKAGTLKPDLIVLDVSMPGMNGIEAAHCLRELLPNVAIVMFTIHRSRLLNAEAIAAGANAVVFKEDGMGLVREAMALLHA